MSEAENPNIEDDLSGFAPPSGDAATPKRRKRGPNKARAEAASLGEDGTPPDAEGAAKPVRRKREMKPEKLEALAGRIYGLHQMVSMMTGLPEMQLQEGEARALAQSVAELSREFDVEVGGRWMVLIGCIGTAAMIYVPRALVIRQKVMSARRDAPKSAAPQSVQREEDLSGPAPMVFPDGQPVEMMAPPDGDGIKYPEAVSSGLVTKHAA